jgi:S1-C subfamily serine protease
VVEVKGDQGLGSGVILTKNGYIVTNNHVVSGQQQLTVRLSDGKNLPAKLIGVDTVDDLAVVKINANNLPPATLGNSGDLRVGQSLLAIGNPLGIVSTVTDGIVSALHRSVSEGQQTNGRILNAIQTSAAINPGNSGGALINLAGQVIGIPTLTAVDPEFNAPAAGVGFAIPSSTVKNITSQIMKYGKVMHSGIAALGIQAYPQSITPSIARQNNLPVDHGVLIRQVESNGPAAKAGIHANDIVVKIGSTTITSYEDMLGALAQHKPGDTIDVTVVTPQRQQHTYKIKLGELNVNNG